MKLITIFQKWVLLIVFSTASVLTFGQKYSGLTATASSGDASLAVDNNTGTRWESASTDPQWLVVDLGEVKNINAIKIYWEAANAKDYTLSFSSDGVSYSNVLSYTDMAEGTRTDLISNLDINCRYIRLDGTARNLTYGYSIWEFEVYPAASAVLTSLSVTPADSKITLGNSQQLAVSAYDQMGNAYSLTAATAWSVDGTGASVDQNGLFTSTSKGVFEVTATNSSVSGSTTVEVLPDQDNLSVGATATASTGTASAAIDNNSGTRWESASEDPQWIMVDFGAKKHISDIIISWEAANAKDYIIETSENGADWSPLLTENNMAEGARVDRYYDLSADAQYVKLTGTARNLTYGYSIWEFQIYGNAGISTGIESPSSNVSSVFFNSNSGEIQFSNKIVKAELFNLQGQKLMSVENANSLLVSGISKGVYVVKVTDQNGKTEAKKLSL